MPIIPPASPDGSIVILAPGVIGAHEPLPEEQMERALAEPDPAFFEEDPDA